MAAELHVSISAETIAQIGPLEITNSMFTGVVVSLFLIIFAAYFSTLKLKKKNFGLLQNIVELFVEGMFNMCKGIAGEKKARDFFPLIATFLIFIMLNNWFGLLPGVGTIGITHPAKIAQVTPVQASESEDIEYYEEGNLYGVAEVEEPDSEHEDKVHVEFIPLFRAATADLNGTLALALITMILVQVYGVKYQGAAYFTKFFNFKDGPIFTFVGVLELLSDISKIVSFAFRLFGNIFAGEVLLAVIAFLVPVLAPLPFIGLEIFVGFVQALVFAMLSLVFINMATEGHQH